MLWTEFLVERLRRTVNAILRMIKGRIHCAVRRGGWISYYPVGKLSITAHSYKKILAALEGYFKTPELKQ